MLRPYWECAEGGIIMTDTLFEQIYKLVRCIPPGKVATYGQIAKMLGMPQAARTVGWAMGSVPAGSDVPWQRVINSRGTISLPAGSPGAIRQRAMLEAEGIVFDPKGRVNLKRYGWQGLDPVQIAAGDLDEGEQQDDSSPYQLPLL
jgi:methylated-DNA-protein-cysteine methyltransferase-like protein